MHIDGWTLALQTINVVVLIWLLSRFLYRPVMAAIAARQAAAAKLVADAETSRSQAQDEVAELQRKSQALAAGEAEVLRRARAQAETERAALLDAAAGQIAKARAQADADLDVQVAAARKRLRSAAVALAADMAGKLLGRIPLQPVAEAMFADLLARLTALPPVERAKLIAPGASIRVTTAEPLGEADEARYAAALREALPGLGGLAFEVDRDLIAGFELSGPSVLVSNSWRADLAQLAAALNALETSGHVA
jgi:F-type H+-transporting ATPase subunit b